MPLELLLALQQRWRRIARRQDVALDEVFFLGAVRKAFLEVVGGALAFKLKGFGLQGSARVLAL